MFTANEKLKVKLSGIEEENGSLLKSIIAGRWLSRLISRMRGICDPDGRHTAKKQIMTLRSMATGDGGRVVSAWMEAWYRGLKPKMIVSLLGALSELISAIIKLCK
jgi:hypothetical protein